MAEILRHRQTKEAATDMFSLQPPRHIPTLPKSAAPPTSPQRQHYPSNRTLPPGYFLWWDMSDIPLEPTAKPCDRDQRRQGCAAPAGLDLDDGARRGRMMAGRRLVVVLVGDANSRFLLYDGRRFV